MTFQDAKLKLEPFYKAQQDEAFHSIFDDLIEERLMELDPKFMQEMTDYYEKCDMARWCA